MANSSVVGWVNPKPAHCASARLPESSLSDWYRYEM
jgi:hypothetical protein